MRKKILLALLAGLTTTGFFVVAVYFGEALAMAYAMIIFVTASVYIWS